jgi:hypothetical protein
MENWRIFLWAAMHSPEFRLCYIETPIALRFRAGSTAPGVIYWLGINFQPFKIYVPWSVRSAYSKAHRLKTYDDFDDIPF